MLSISRLGFVALLAVLVSNPALACGTSDCYERSFGNDGSTTIDVSGWAGAYGNNTFAASFGSFDWTVNGDGENFISMQGGFQGVSEGNNGYSEAGGVTHGYADWVQGEWSAGGPDYGSYGGDIAVNVAVDSAAHGDDTISGGSGMFNWGTSSTDHGWIGVGGAFQSFSEEHGYSEAGGWTGGQARWIVNYGSWDSGN